MKTLNLTPVNTEDQQLTFTKISQYEYGVRASNSDTFKNPKIATGNLVQVSKKDGTTSQVILGGWYYNTRNEVSGANHVYDFFYIRPEATVVGNVFFMRYQGKDGFKPEAGDQVIVRNGSATSIVEIEGAEYKTFEHEGKTYKGWSLT